MIDAGLSGTEAQTILCDTSFVSVMQSTRGVIDALPEVSRARLDSAVLAISVITLAELRDGHIYARWSEKRRLRAERLIASYLLVPLDMPVVNRCAEMRAACRRAGVSIPDNDIWIAATASTRDWPLASCDSHFDLIDGIEHIRLPISR